jgi:hypothetical protein
MLESTTCPARPSEGVTLPINFPSDDETVHRWYRIIMGFDWKLVQYVIDLLSIGPQHLVLDPFCGAGTTLVQCKKHGIPSVGIDANPICTLASNVKTSWYLQPESLKSILDRVLYTASRVEEANTVRKNSALRYLCESGMIDRGWLSLHKAKKVVALRIAIQKTPMRLAERRFFNLALISAVVDRIADIKFGPEVYCLANPKRNAVTRSFSSLAMTMISDIDSARTLDHARIRSNVFLGDSRRSDILKKAVPGGADFVLTSPPYPNEHDYTRSTRLELVMLGYVQDTMDLRILKQRMVRCNTKGLYTTDFDARLSAHYPSVQKIAHRLDRRGKEHTDRFSQLYGRMIREYFGGMISHLRSTMKALRPGGRCAYVIRDQQSLLGVYIDTPKILSAIATSPAQGFRLDDVIEWKKARGSTGVRTLSEKIIILRKPDN